MSRGSLPSWRAVLTGKPYPVRALYCQGSNPALSYANSPLVVEALRSMDFIAVADFFMTPTAGLADIVLPVATWLERTSIQTFFQVPMTISICSRRPWRSRIAGPTTGS
jgi:thiosulfate reductase/polysulfide reductase chain A